ncbi:MAG: ABC transporter substrate-binding protein [Chloroflexi bacterium]|nr:ABC transporter substrate-binding protein [Chloroflexota bacterium]
MRILALALTAALVATACGGTTLAPTPTPRIVQATTVVATAAVSSSPAPAPVTLKWGSISSASDSALFIAEAKGYFAQQGITLDTQVFTTAANMVGPLGQDQIQVGGGVVGAGLFNAIARGINIKIVGDKGDLDPGNGFEAIVVRTQLADRVKGPTDLKGRTYAMASLDITPEVTLNTYLGTGGLTVKDVNIVTLGFPDMQSALETGRIDAAGPIEPWLTKIVEAGVAKVLVRSDEITPGQQQSVLLFSEQFAKRRDVAVRFMVAYLEGARFYNDAFVKKDPAKRAEAARILAKATKLDPALFAKMTMPGIDPNGKVNVDWLQKDQQYFVGKGTQAKAVDLSTAVDPSFASDAVTILGGPYQ